MDYKKAYLELFNAITETIEELKCAQIEAEKIIIHDAPSKEDKAAIIELLVISNNK